MVEVDSRSLAVRHISNLSLSTQGTLHKGLRVATYHLALLVGCRHLRSLRARPHAFLALELIVLEHFSLIYRGASGAECDPANESKYLAAVLPISRFNSLTRALKV
jgi:hypothetical protein